MGCHAVLLSSFSLYLSASVSPSSSRPLSLFKVAYKR